MSQCSDDIFILYHVIVDRYGEMEQTEDLIYVEWKAKYGETIFIDRFVIEEDHIKHDFWIEKYKSKMLWM